MYILVSVLMLVLGAAVFDGKGSDSGVWTRGVSAIGVCVVLLVAGCTPTSSSTDEDAAVPATTITTMAVAATVTTVAPATPVTTMPATTSSQAGTPTTSSLPVSASGLPVVFADGTWLVGTDIEPGIYMTVASGFLACWWDRLSALSGAARDTDIGGDMTYARAIVEVRPDDLAFRSQGCGEWTYLWVPDQPWTRLYDGDWAVGSQLAPGRYRNGEGREGCHWERLSGWLGINEEIIEWGESETPTEVVIEATDVGFSSDACGPWERVDE